FGPAELKLITILVKKYRNFSTLQSHINRSIELGNGFGRLIKLNRIAWIQNCHTRHGPQDCQVFYRLMGRPCKSGQTRQPTNDLDIGPTIVDIDCQLLISPSGCKNSISSYIRNETCSRHAARDPE